jgi:hypothetical protein
VLNSKVGIYLASLAVGLLVSALVVVFVRFVAEAYIDLPLAELGRGEAVFAAGLVAAITVVVASSAKSFMLGVSDQRDERGRTSRF